MKVKAMYLGYRKVHYDKRTTEDGTIMPETNGKTLTFFQNEWKGNKLKENGMFLNYFINDNEEKEITLTKGEIVDVDIINIDKRQCKLLEDIDEEEDEE